MNQRRAAALFHKAAILMACAAPMMAQSYTAFDAPNPLGNDLMSQTTGTAVGRPSSNEFTTIDAHVAGVISTVANGINSRGEVVGAYRDTNGAFHGFLL